MKDSFLVDSANYAVKYQIMEDDAGFAEGRYKLL